MAERCIVTLLAAPLGFHAGLASRGTRAILDLLKSQCDAAIPLAGAHPASTFLPLFSDAATPGHLAKSLVLKFLAVRLKKSPAEAHNAAQSVRAEEEGKLMRR